MLTTNVINVIRSKILRLACMLQIIGIILAISFFTVYLVKMSKCQRLCCCFCLPMLFYLSFLCVNLCYHHKGGNLTFSYIFHGCCYIVDGLNNFRAIKSTTKVCNIYRTFFIFTVDCVS